MKQLLTSLLGTLMLLSCAMAQDTVSRTVSVPVLTAVTVPTTTTPSLIRNVGQSAHWLKYCFTNSTSVFQIQLEGSEDGSNWAVIGNVGTATTGCSMIEAGGYHNYLRVNLVNAGSLTGSVSAWYTGSASPLSIQTSPYNITAGGDNPSGSGNVAILAPLGNKALLGIAPYLWYPADTTYSGGSNNFLTRIYSMAQAPLGTLGMGVARMVALNSVAATGSQISRTLAVPMHGLTGILQFSAASITGSPSGCSLTVTGEPTDTLTNNGQQSFNFTPANGSQVFYVSLGSGGNLTDNIQVLYSCSTTYPATGTISVSFDPVTPVGGTLSALEAAASTDNGAVVMEKGGRWTAISNPAAGSQASASKAAGGAGVVHVADCITFSAVSTTAPVLTALTINLRDGATGAGTIKRTWQVAIPAATGQNVAPTDVCGLNIQGTANTAMTLEFSASLANLIESVSISGYDVN